VLKERKERTSYGTLFLHSNVQARNKAERSREVSALINYAFKYLPFVIASISQFFANLEGDVVAFALAASTFFFAWAAILYMTSGENQRRIEFAKMSLYAALTGLALALLAGTIAGLVNGAASGQ
jgi:hypothetical protein